MAPSTSQELSADSRLPPNVQLSLPSSHAVLPGNFTRGPLSPSYHTISNTPLAADTVLFPIDITHPFIAVHPSFLDILGPSPKLDIIASTEKALGGDDRQFAHEAGVWDEETGEVWYVSNLYKVTGDSKEGGWGPKNQIAKIKIEGAEERGITESWEDVVMTPEVHCGNGATLLGDSILFCAQGTRQIPSSLSVISTKAPHKSHQLLNNFMGRPFNSINDVVVLPAPSLDSSQPHPTTDRSDLHHLPHTTIWFTDPTYGYAQGYKDKPQLPNQVYCFNPTTGDCRMVADRFGMCNGLCFNLEGDRLYVTDTEVISPGTDEDVRKGNWVIDGAKRGTIYVFDVVRPPHGVDLTAAGPTLHNRRVFAFTDAGAPDGIKCDRQGNVYSGCHDGVQVWNSYGTLIGKILLPPTSLPKTPQPWSPEDLEKPEFRPRGAANFNFIPGGKMVVFAEDRIYKVTLKEDVEGALLLKK